MNKLYIVIAILLSSTVLFSQTYPQNFRQPLGGTLLLTGSFCEFRSNHFHGGDDFRTGTNGKPVYAIADGYVFRIKVAGGGYGNALYLYHPEGDGYISVYGHLQSYIPQIAKWVEGFQDSIQEFAFDHYLDSNLIPVKKGQVVAYSGNTGRSFGPHLHFEIRNQQDEPFNPQLFGYRIADTRAPEIRNIAVYPADDNSYVNYANYSSVFSVSGNSVNSNITVHGNVYFGIEAYDYLNDVSSRNSVYSTKLYVDGKLIYYSQFDRFSYYHNRDINSMVDYKRRVTTDMRIQRCYVEPNNDLYHYKALENNGVVSFTDNQYHSVKFVVADIYGNTKTVSFSVKSSTTEKDFGIVRDSTMFMAYDKENVFTRPGIEIFFPEKSLFDNIFLEYNTSEGSEYSPMFQIHNEFVPVKNDYILSLNLSLVPDDLKDKAVICFVDYKNDIACYTGTVKDNFLSVFTNDFGRFYLDVDVIPPYITPLNISDGANMKSHSNIKFKITDNLSGINDWSGFVNGEWVIVKYDAKNDLIWYNFDDKTKSGKNTFTLLVVDGVGNISEYKAVFYR